MEFSTSISQYNTEYNLNAIQDYNKYLKNNQSFSFDDATPTEFEQALQTAAKSYPVKDKNDPEGLGNFMGNFGHAFSDGINAVNNLRLEANRKQEDIAMGGSTDIHAAMIAAEKASLSMQMAIQVRNRILNAYSDITTMGI